MSNPTFLPDFFVFQDWRPRGARPVVPPNYGHDCFAEMVKTAGSREDLARQLQAGDWHIDVLNCFCFHSGLSRDLYNPLDPYGKDGGPLCWKLKTVSEFVDWYLKRYPLLVITVPVLEREPGSYAVVKLTGETGQRTDVPIDQENIPEPARKRGRPKKEQAGETITQEQTVATV
jgi:hypothetical protein